MHKVVFISSTYVDLAEYRREVWRVLEGFQVTPKGMEQFGAKSVTPLETCLAEVTQSDVYVGIIAFRLGSIETKSDKSFTQLEYEHAARLGKTILIYLADEEAARFRKADFDLDPINRARLDAFKGTLRENHTVDWFSTPEDLAEKIKTALKEHFQPVIERDENPASEFANTLALVRRFRLLPGMVSGREVRLKSRISSVFPASRVLCKAFNLDYGRTIGARVRILEPKHKDMEGFREIYASGLRVDEFLSLANAREPVDIYARLQFTPDDVPRGSAEFFGYHIEYSEPEPEEPEVIYVAPEGRVILLFSKTAS
jgi:Domain of unknown function (DUF4062)